MKAIVQDRYGAPEEVLELREIENPDVGDDEVLVRVRAAAANPYDWHFVRGLPMVMRPGIGLRGPKQSIRGIDLAGLVEAVGDNVETLQPGNEVFGWAKGAFAEYVCAPQDQFAAKPARLSFEQAAALPLAAVTALQGLRDAGEVKSGQKVLIIGASGGVGTFAVQIAKWLGAEVTGVCSTKNMELVRSLGADRVIDYTAEDFTAGAEQYDVILQLGGTMPASACRRALKPQGIFVSSSGTGGGRLFGPMVRIMKPVLLSRFWSQKVVSLDITPNRDDLVLLAELIESGKLTPVIDKTYPLSEAAEAIRYVETEHARGKVVITV